MPLFHHAGALGDFLLSLPFARAVQRRFGVERWTLAAPTEHARLVHRVFPHVDRIAPGAVSLAPLVARELEPARVAEILDRYGGLVGFFPRARELSELARKLRPDLLVAIVEPLAIAVSADRSIEAVLGEALDALLGSAIADLGDQRAPLGPHNFAIEPGELPMLDSPADLRALESLPIDRPSALVHVGASDPRKAPPRAELDALRARLERSGIVTVWVRGPVEVERNRSLPEGPSLDSPSLVALAHAILRASLFAGGDTGPTHLASALGCPTVALHLSPNSAWRPRGSCACIVESFNAIDIDAFEPIAFLKRRVDSASITPPPPLASRRERRS